MGRRISETAPLMSDETLIAEVHERIDTDVETVLDALNAIWGSGFADEESGNVEAPCGHFFRVEHWIVTTDSQGFHNVETFCSIQASMVAFSERDHEYAEWDDE
jgi:hypothetical protein